MRPPLPTPRFRRPARLAAKAATAATAALALGAALAVWAPAAYAAGPQKAAGSPTGTVRTLDVPGDGTAGKRSVGPRTTAPFSMVGMTWDDPGAQLGGAAEVRTRDAFTGRWSGWHALDTDVRAPESGPDRDRPGVRGGTQPLWTGAADGIQVRVVGKALPAGLRVELVDPDGGATKPTTAPTTVTASGASAASGASVSSVAAGTATAVPQPPVTSRAGWGADESMVADPPSYTTDTKAVFVHHTAGTNDYTCAESASVVRGIFTYHVQSNGWNDLGYHFLVDKCGTVFEGRAGGIDKPVVGAHTYGFNTDTSSISVLGDYNTATTNAAVRDSIAKVAAWKLGLYGINPSGTVVLTAAADNGKYTAGQQVTLNRISGHRDGYPTECPGNNLYADLPAIRTQAAAANSPAPTGDFNRDGRTDPVFGVPEANAFTVVPGASTGMGGPYAKNKQTLTQNSTGVPGATEAGDDFGGAVAYGNLNGDAYADLVVAAPGEDNTTETDGNHGALTVFDGSANGFVPRASQILTNGSQDRFGSHLATGDFDGDGDDEIAATAPGSGTVHVVDGRTGARTTPVREGSGAPVAFTALAAGDFDADGRTDLAYGHDGTRLSVAYGSAGGLTAPRALGDAGGASLAAGDLNGDGYADLVAGRPDAATGGEVRAYLGSADGPVTAGGGTVLRYDAEDGDRLGASVAVGDTDADGYADILAGAPGEDVGTQTDAGAVVLFPGAAQGATTEGAAAFHTDLPDVPGAAEAGDHLGSAVLLADLTGDGRADLGIGSDGENGLDGTALTVTSGPAGPVPAGGLYFGPATLGVTAATHIGRVLAP